MSGRSRASLVSLAVALVFFGGTAAHAQVFIGSSGPRPGSVEISGGGSLTGGRTFDASRATLTPNPPATGGFDLFTSEPSLGAGPGAQATVTVYVTRALAIEGGFQFARPKLKVELSDDTEGAPDITASTTISQYLFTGSLVYHFGGHGRVVPFVAGGAGHLRDAHDGNGLVETGTEFHGKAGFKMWFGRRQRVGFRAEGGVSVRDGGFSFEEGRWAVPTGAVSLAYRF